jgi:hypothetical protein
MAFIDHSHSNVASQAIVGSKFIFSR